MQVRTMTTAEVCTELISAGIEVQEVFLTRFKNEEDDSITLMTGQMVHVDPMGEARIVTLWGIPGAKSVHDRFFRMIGCFETIEELVNAIKTGYRGD